MASTAGRPEFAICAAGRMYWIAALVPIYSTPTIPTPAISAMGRLRSGRFTSTRHHGQVVPAVIGPQRRNQCDHKSFHATLRAGKARMKVGQATVRAGKAEPGDPHHQQHLEPGKEQLKITGLLDAEVVEPGDQPRSNNGKHLRPRNQQGSAQYNAIQPRQRQGRCPARGLGRS